jgi:hypothetical protein
MSLTIEGKDTKSIIKELNKEWRDYKKKADSLIDGEITKTQKNITFIIRRKKGCDVPLCDIIEYEMKKLEHLLDNI